MKPEDLRKKSIEQLTDLKRTLEFELFKSKSDWGKVIKIKGVQHDKSKTAKGTNTSLTKDLRRNIARILTIINEKEKDGRNNILLWRS